MILLTRICHLLRHLKEGKEGVQVVALTIIRPSQLLLMLKWYVSWEEVKFKHLLVKLFMSTCLAGRQQKNTTAGNEILTRKIIV